MPSRTKKPAMTPSEASVRLSSRAYFALSLFSRRVRLGSGSVCSKLHTFQDNGELDLAGGSPLSKFAAGRDGLAVNPDVANSELRITVGNGGDSETLLTSGVASWVSFNRGFLRDSQSTFHPRASYRPL